MKKKIIEIKIQERYKNVKFAFLPKIVSEAHPDKTIRWLIWLCPYEVYNGVNFLIEE